MTGKTVTYLVSGGIHPCEVVLKNSGRRVRFADEVNQDAAKEIKHSGRYVVVAHGNGAGTIFWHSSTTDAPVPWLWMQMKRTPRNARMYLYACRAGPKLRKELKHCECFGHSDVVPIPEGGSNDIILSYLDQVDTLMKAETFDFEVWRSHLGSFVDEAYVRLIEQDSFSSIEDLQNTMSLLQLRKSLGFPDANR